MLKVPGDAAVTVVVAAALLLGLIVRDELPTTPTPAPPLFVLDMEGASIGSESNSSGTFWTIDADAAAIEIVNTSSDVAEASVTLRLVDGPCGSGAEVSFRHPGGERTVRVPAGDSASVVLPAVEVPPLGRTEIELETSGPPCDPVGADPRSIHFQVFALAANS
jgi:hypothetical protein